MFCFLLIMYTTINKNFAQISLIGLGIASLQIVALHTHRKSSDRLKIICLSTWGPNGCTTATAILSVYYLTANLIGMYFAYIYYCDTRKYFTNLYQIWEEKKQKNLAHFVAGKIFTIQPQRSLMNAESKRG